MAGGPEQPGTPWVPPAAGPSGPPAAPAGPGLQPQKTSGFAIASLVLGILGLPVLCPLLIPSVLAVVFGFLARRDVRDKGHSGNGMAIAGLIMGFIGIVASIAVIIFGAIYLANADWGDPDHDDVPNFIDDHDHNPNLDVIRPVALLAGRLLCCIAY